MSLSQCLLFSGIRPSRCAKNSSGRTDVFTSTSTMSMATVGTSAIIVRRSAFASVRSTLDNLKSTRYGSVCELLEF